MSPNTTLERKTNTGFYSYIFVAPIDKSLFYCEGILRNNHCRPVGFTPFNEEDNIGRYSFKQPLNETIITILQDMGCEVYSKI